MEILLIASYYPYDYGDTAFIRPEAQFLSEAFEKVHVLTALKEAFKYKKIDLPANTEIVPPEIYLPRLSSKKERIKSVFISFSHPFKLSKILLSEYSFLLKRGKFNPQVFITAITWLLNANLLSVILKQYLSANPEIKMIYTFWYKYETLASIICKQYFNIPIKCITRTHGGDLYEFVQENKYQPYKKWMDKHIDRIFFASKAGYDYYLNSFAAQGRDKYTIARLGIENHYTFKDIDKAEFSTKCLNIISCSFMVPGKRIQLIVEALSNMDEMNINWIHIGDGIERENLERISKSLLETKSNIRYNFMGYLKNDSIKKLYYDTYFNCFVSTTATEGGNPVSMIEAISFGIPIIASNVGGVPEIVNNDTGILLDPDNCVNELVNALYRFSAMTAQETERLRRSCREFWESNYRAETQYSQFADTLKEIIQSDK